jgi:hypothetical protein
MTIVRECHAVNPEAIAAPLGSSERIRYAVRGRAGSPKLRMVRIEAVNGVLRAAFRTVDRPVLP